MPQGDYEGALKRALHISAKWLKIFNAGKGGVQGGWDADAGWLGCCCYAKATGPNTFI